MLGKEPDPSSPDSECTALSKQFNVSHMILLRDHPLSNWRGEGDGGEGGAGDKGAKGGGRD